MKDESPPVKSGPVSQDLGLVSLLIFKPVMRCSDALAMGNLPYKQLKQLNKW